MRFHHLSRSLLILLVFMAGACAGGIKVEETNGDSIEPIPTLPNDRPLLLEVLPVAPSIDDEQEDEQEPAETAPVAPEPSPGFIGSPCRSSSDCLENLECADEDEGFDSGHCTQECELYCPDLEGYPTTFCPDLGDALTRCFSRCEPQPSGSPSNCRQGYRCVPMPRANAPQIVQHVCAPSAWLTDASLCNDGRGMVQSIECFHHKASFGDAELRELNTKILNADATTEDAERYLDLSYELSQAYLESMLGRPPYPNRSQGHRQDSPMRGIVVHYTANQYEEPTIRYFSSEDPHASTHFMIGALDNGLVLQLFSHRDRTWHAGSLFNHSHFGIDFANAGYLERDDEEQWVDYLGRDYTSVLPTFGGNPVAIGDGIPGEDLKYTRQSHWQPYTTHQLIAFVLVSRALHLMYGLDPDEIVRHGDVSSSRVDPGPALPHTALRELIFNQDDVLADDHWLQNYRWDAAWIVENPQAR